MIYDPENILRNYNGTSGFIKHSDTLESILRYIQRIVCLESLSSQSNISVRVIKMNVGCQEMHTKIFRSMGQ